MKDIEEIKKYDISYYAGTDDEDLPYRAIIGLRRKDNSIIGIVYFHREADNIQCIAQRSVEGHILVHFPAIHYQQVLDLLRNEKPVYLRYVEGTMPYASINTAMEIVGDGESSQ